MPDAPTPPVAAAPAKVAKPKADAAAVIRLVQGLEESSHDRLLKKHLPAWVVSGAFHVVFLILFIVIGSMGKPPVQASDEIITTVVEDKPQEEDKKDLTNPDEGIDSSMKKAVEVDRQEDLNIETKVTPDQPIGVAGADSTVPMDSAAPAGLNDIASDPGVKGLDGSVLTGPGGAGGTSISKGLAGRSGASKEQNLKAGGGNDKSEAAVAKGLTWLAKQQRRGGEWVYDGTAGGDTVAATAMALLPFLAAGHTHKTTGGQQNYAPNVRAGIEYLLKNQIKTTGTFTGIQPNHHMYAHAVATMALCECYGMSLDKGKLLYPCQNAINFIVKSQGRNGSWGYSPNNEGDTSIVGWQIQALKSGEMCKDLTVDKNAMKKATKFLDTVSDTSRKSTYGYRTAPGRPATGLTAVGLLCRYYIDGWGPVNAGMSEGVQQFVNARPPEEKSKMDIYYYYYATQVVHFHDGEPWHKSWNPKMRDLLIKLQVAGKGEKVDGSWDQDGEITGNAVGRLGTTCMALLTLEVYYRHLPLYKRGTGGEKELDRGVK